MPPKRLGAEKQLDIGLATGNLSELDANNLLDILARQKVGKEMQKLEREAGRGNFEAADELVAKLTQILDRWAEDSGTEENRLRIEEWRNLYAAKAQTLRDQEQQYLRDQEQQYLLASTGEDAAAGTADHAAAPLSPRGDEPIDEPVDEPVDEPADEPAAAPAADPINDRCVICQFDFSADRDVLVIRLDCGHIFHVECILKWAYRSDECPVCRREPISARSEPTTYENLVDTIDAAERTGCGPFGNCWRSIKRKFTPDRRPPDFFEAARAGAKNNRKRNKRRRNKQTKINRKNTIKIKNKKTKKIKNHRKKKQTKKRR